MNLISHLFRKARAVFTRPAKTDAPPQPLKARKLNFHDRKLIERRQRQRRNLGRIAVRYRCNRTTCRPVYS